MANPLDAFKGLKPWQQGAVVVGGVGVVGAFVLYERKQKASAAAAGAAAVPSTSAGGATSATVGDMVTDPTTGETYPADSVDPATGLTYAAELQEYGSVAAADEEGAEAGDAAVEEGLTQTEYDEETGQPIDSVSGTSATNAQWITEVETSLSQLGYANADIQQGLAKYFSSSPQGISSDGTNLYTMMDTAVGEYGPPPTGTYALINGTTGASAGTGSGSGSGSGAPTGTPQTGPDPVTASTTASDLTVSWPAVGGADKYEVLVMGPDAGTKSDTTVTVTHAVYSIATAGTNGSVKVRAGNASGWGPYSASKTFKFTATTAKK